MRNSPRRRTACSAVIVTAMVLMLTALAGSPSAGAAPSGPPAVLSVGAVASQDVPTLDGSEPDTLVEPDVAVSPLDPTVAVAAAHDGRYPNGGAVGIETAWTHDGGRSWHHRPLPGVTTTTGGPEPWARASDPVVAFGPDGDVYVSTLLFDLGCDSAVAVSRSDNGGESFEAPVLVHSSSTCAVSDDKNWLIVDTQSASPHRGRLYQFWTPFLTTPAGNADGSPQVMAFSDDHATTWSAPVAVSPPHANSQNSQPMILPSGRIVDAYLDSGAAAATDGPEAAEARGGSRARATPNALSANPNGNLVTAVSSDGGQTWATGGLVTTDVGSGPAGVRCCLPSSVADPVTGILYSAWDSLSPGKVKLSRSRDGVHWSRPLLVNHTGGGRQAVNVDVAADNGTVAVSFALAGPGTPRFAQQYVATSRDSGRSFPFLTAIGPTSDYRYAAFARGLFPGDYVGSAMSHGRYYALWCVSSRPEKPAAKYHQVLYAAAFADSVVRAAGDAAKN
jgi:hypothetical protein